MLILKHSVVSLFLGKYCQCSFKTFSLILKFRPHSRTNDTREVMMRLTAHHDDPKALGLVAMETIPVS